MHKTLLNPLPRAAERWSFKPFCRTDLQNLLRQNFIENFSKTYWVEIIFKSIRSINRTDSEVDLDTYMCEDNDLSKTPANSHPQKTPFG